MVGVISPEVSMVSAALREEERFGGFFRYEGQVDVFSGEGPLVGAAEQEQCFSEVDRSGVDDAEAVDELAVVAVRIVVGDVEKCLRDCQRVRNRGRRWLRISAVRRPVLRAARAWHRSCRRARGTRLCGLPTGSGGRATRSRPCVWRL